MAISRHSADENPLLLISINRVSHQQRLYGAVSRIWDTPEIHIQEDIKSVLGLVIAHSLNGREIRPDIVILDLETYCAESRAIFTTIRSITALRHTPVLALVDTASADVRDMIYDAGADLVVAWENLEHRIGDIAGLAVDNWLNTTPELESVPVNG